MQTRAHFGGPELFCSCVEKCLTSLESSLANFFSSPIKIYLPSCFDLQHYSWIFFIDRSLDLPFSLRIYKKIGLKWWSIRSICMGGLEGPLCGLPQLSWTVLGSFNLPRKVIPRKRNGNRQFKKAVENCW